MGLVEQQLNDVNINQPFVSRHSEHPYLYSVSSRLSKLNYLPTLSQSRGSNREFILAGMGKRTDYYRFYLLVDVGLGKRTQTNCLGKANNKPNWLY